MYLTVLQGRQNIERHTYTQARTIAPLQRVQNAAARLITGIGRRDHVTPALRKLHWLPIPYRITYKLCVLMHQVHSGCSPS